jgi:uncharacterized protein YrrD
VDILPHGFHLNLLVEILSHEVIRLKVESIWDGAKLGAVEDVFMREHFVSMEV